MKHLVLYLAICLGTCVLSAQNISRIDSLKQQLSEELSDRDRVTILNELAFEYVNYDSAKTAGYAGESIRLSEQIGFPEGKAKAIIQLAWTYFRSGHLETSIDQFKKAFDITKNASDTLNQANVFHGMGAVLTDLGEFDSADSVLDRSLSLHQSIANQHGEALVYNQKGIVSAYRGDFRTCLEYFLKALGIQERLNNRLKLSGNYNNIAIVYQNLDEDEKALEYFLKSMEINEANDDKRGLGINYNNIIPIYKNLGREQEAYALSLRALEINTQLNDQVGIANSLSNIGDYHLDNNRYDSALYYFRKSLQIRQNLNNPGEQTQALISLAETHLAMGQPRKSLSYLNQAKDLSQEVGLLEDYRNTLEILAEAYEMLNEYQLAYQTHVTFKTIADSIINDNKKQDIVRLEEQFAYEKKEDSIKFVQDTERIRFEKEIAGQQARETKIIYGVIILIILILALAFLYYYKQKANAKLVKLNQEIQEQRDHLERLNAMKSRLFSIVSHDIKSPIGVLTGFSEVLISHVSENYDAKNDDQLKIIEKHLNDGKNRLLTLLEDLINWVKSENGTMPFRPKTQEAKPLIETTIENVKSHAESKEIAIDLAMDDSLTLFGDANTLKVIFRNLLNNAIKFTKKDGKVSIRGNMESGSVVIIISDTGIGIPKDSIGKIFEATKEKIRPGTGGESGIGLGLSVVYEFVALNKGTIHVDSEEDKGTSFTLTLPSEEI